ncbi:PstS family phosphate ABC transporter substrate-binding protein [Pedobacter sp. JCM 36344]|uniref:PstS family phosphate ABC transporter substrate-binding protein n=1 Tax=Pedobacter sp. JCM 36344 TaxID=3374280 RepID=UPI00397A9268
MKYLTLIIALLTFASCRNPDKKSGTLDPSIERRTSGDVRIFVDESFSSVIADQIAIFKSDYKNATFKVTLGNEASIIPAFINDSVRLVVLSRMLTHKEDTVFRRRGIAPKTSRFAIDGIALITSNDNVDSNITVSQVIDILNGKSTSGSALVFDNAGSSTLRYFMTLADIKELPSTGVYTLTNNNDVIKYVVDHKNYIGVVGVNWLLANNGGMSEYIDRVKMMGVKNIKGKRGDDQFYKPIQTNLINGVYPFLRNVYIINCEAKDGLGTGFANWVMSQRGQLIVLKSGLGPHKMMPREFNLKNPN